MVNLSIHVLSPEVAGQIAAGEVVERPASVVKELIENALDAGATAISIESQDGGLRLIRVSDNGCGMSRADVPLAVKRFATSKISTSNDLTRVRTLGFRGEALPAIAAVAQMEILTRTQDELEGTRLRVDKTGQTVEPTASPAGASVTVRDLFYNTPARRKFLKSPLREAELVRLTVARYALAYPDVAFRLVVDGRERLAVPPADPRERISAVLGRDVADEMVPIAWEAADLRVSGFISRPTIGRSNREAQFFTVNGRPVRAGLLAVMLERPYVGRLPPGRRPVAVVHIELDPGWVDVNVHPRKAEVRFSQERSVYWALSRAVEDALAPFPRQEGAADMAWPFAGVTEGQAEAPSALREAGAEYMETSGWRALAQAHNSYIVAQSGDGILLVDQHAAHEQVLFERLLQTTKPTPLTPPARLHLTPHEADALIPLIPMLNEFGLEVEPFGGYSFLIRTLPEPLAGVDPVGLVTALLEEVEQFRWRSAEALQERLISKAACFSAIKAGDILTLAEMQQLLDELMATWSPATCPHGRPAFILMSLEELERRFQRR
ncbi:MAG TPA: DNA mismatch repair endonuclease MutL [Anaerolineae bacterium]|nr:DNA mismatch repair endonuclease MutL [Anaerolineae bacterium]